MHDRKQISSKEYQTENIDPEYNMIGQERGRLGKKKEERSKKKTR